MNPDAPPWADVADVGLAKEKCPALTRTTRHTKAETPPASDTRSGRERTSGRGAARWRRSEEGGHEEVRAGVGFLLRTQQLDGSWPAATKGGGGQAAYHPTCAAMLGLAPHEHHGFGPAMPSVLPTLRRQAGLEEEKDEPRPRPYEKYAIRSGEEEIDGHTVHLICAPTIADSTGT